MPALLLLGGFAVAWNQRFLDAASARGLDVLLLDRPGPQAEALRSAGDVRLAAASDLPGIVDHVTTWSRQHDVHGVCVLREEYVEPGAVVADLLGLPSPGLRAARVCRNKYLQRRYLADWSPVSTLADPGRFPVVVKPVGRLASSGVRLVTDADELSACLTGYDPDETLLFEERVVGQEYSVESLSHDGKVVYAEVTQKRTTEGESEYFVELGHTTPAILPGAVRGQILQTHEAVLERLAFGTGMAHAEYRVTAAGRPVLIEIAARPPGDSILALHWLATGAPLEDAIVGLAVGETVSHPEPRRYARQVYLTHPPGVLDDLVVEGIDRAPVWFDPAEIGAQIDACGAADDPATVRCVMALKPRGTRLGPIRESSDRAAMFVVDAPTPSTLDAISQRCERAISLRVGS
jgi:biotin carboxylase